MADIIQRVVEPFLAQCDRLLGDGYSAVLHGSVARGEHLEGWSDVNLLLVLPSAEPQVLRALSAPFAAWAKHHEPPPLLLSREEWRRAADAFPIEITDIRSAYRVLRGADPMSEVAVRPAELRAALERDLRGKLLRLRQGYVALASDPGALGALARDTLPSVIVLLRAVLALAGAQVPVPRAAVADIAGRVTGIDTAVLKDILARLGDAAWACSADQFTAYLAVVEAVLRHVDHLTPGDLP